MSPGRHMQKIRAYLRCAQTLATLSTCLRMKVGVVLLRADGSTASTGYNGALPNAPHCTPEHCNPTTRCLNTRHAERSALDYSEGPIHTACITHEPCRRCTLDLIARGVRAIYWVKPYLSEDAAERAAKMRIIEAHNVLFEQVADPLPDMHAVLDAAGRVVQEARHHDRGRGQPLDDGSPANPCGHMPGPGLPKRLQQTIKALEDATTVHLPDPSA